MSTPTTAPTPSPEMEALMRKTTKLSKLVLEIAKLTMDINEEIPVVVAARVADALDALTPPAPQWLHGTARTPAEMEAAFPAGFGDHQAWYVVIVGREPGLYRSSTEADAQVNGVPGQFRQKKTSRREALDFYCSRYNAGVVDKQNEVAPAAPAVAAPAVAAPATAPAQQ